MCKEIIFVERQYDICKDGTIFAKPLAFFNVVILLLFVLRSEKQQYYYVMESTHR